MKANFTARKAILLPEYIENVNIGIIYWFSEKFLIDTTKYQLNTITRILICLDD